MDKIQRFKKSIERLLKVWRSKLYINEDLLVKEDMLWFAKTFDSFFEKKNFNEFININGEFSSNEADGDLDLSSLFLKISDVSSNVETVKYTDFDADFENSRYNEFIGREIKDNVFDIYIYVLKKLYEFSVDQNSRRSQIVIGTTLRKIFFKTLSFEREGVNSSKLVTDFLNERVLNSLSDRELKSDYPSKDFILYLNFTILLSFYREVFITSEKSNIVLRFLFKVWERFNRNGLFDFQSSLLEVVADLTITKYPYRQIDLFGLNQKVEKGVKGEVFIELLKKLEYKGRKIITKQDYLDFVQIFDDCIKADLPKGIELDEKEYFIKNERDLALELYKFRSVQFFILEILSRILHQQGKEKFNDAFLVFRKNEEYSNQRSFYPKNEENLFVWFLIARNLKFDILRDFYGSVPSRLLEHVFCFIISKSINSKIEDSIFREVVFHYEYHLNPEGVFSLLHFVEGLLEGLEDNSLLDEPEKVSLKDLLNTVVFVLNYIISDSEKNNKIPVSTLIKFRDSVISRYRERSIIVKLEGFLVENPLIGSLRKSFKSFARRNELIQRKYFVPNWHTPLYGLSENVGDDLVDQEIIHFENFLFFDLKIPETLIYSKSQVLEFLSQLVEPSFLFFRNTFPDYWLNIKSSGAGFGGKKLEIEEVHSFIRYSTVDRLSELIVIPKNGIEVEKNELLDLDRLEFFEDQIYWSFKDLSEDFSAREEILINPPEFIKSAKDMEEELRKFLWLRAVTSNKISIDPLRINRLKLDPYGA